MHAARRTRPSARRERARLCIFKTSREPLATRAGKGLTPVHVLRVHLELDATGAHQALLVFWTMSSGAAVYQLRRCDALITALRSTASVIHSHLMGLPPDALVDLCPPCASQVSFHKVGHNLSSLTCAALLTRVAMQASKSTTQHCC
jgi:hypothetical protein